MALFFPLLFHPPVFLDDPLQSSAYDQKEYYAFRSCTYVPVYMFYSLPVPQAARAVASQTDLNRSKNKS